MARTVQEEIDRVNRLRKAEGLNEAFGQTGRQAEVERMYNENKRGVRRAFQHDVPGPERPERPERGRARRAVDAVKRTASATKTAAKATKNSVKSVISKPRLSPGWLSAGAVAGGALLGAHKAGTDPEWAERTAYKFGADIAGRDPNNPGSMRGPLNVLGGMDAAFFGLPSAINRFGAAVYNPVEGDTGADRFFGGVQAALDPEAVRRRQAAEGSRLGFGLTSGRNPYAANQSGEPTGVPPADMATEPFSHFRDPRVDNDRQVATSQPSQDFPGAWDSETKGVGVRRGPSSEPEFFNAGRYGDPIRAGEIGVMPAQAMMQMDIPDNRGAIRAAAARGDWSALERVGAIDQRTPRGGGGGGGYYGGRRSDLVSEGAAMVREAQKLMSSAQRASPYERSGLIRQAKALMDGAKSLGVFGIEEGKLANESARNSALGRGGAADPTEAMKNIAQAGLFDAQRVKALSDAGQIDPTLLTVMDAIGTDRARELSDSYISRLTNEERRRTADGIMNAAGSYESILEQLQSGLYKDMPDIQLLLAGNLEEAGFDVSIPKPEAEEGGTLDWLRGRAEGLGLADGGYIEEFADGGYVDPMMSATGGYGMEASLGPMGALGMGGGSMGMPDMMQVEYAQYAQGAQKLGLPQIPFEEFVSLKTQQIPQAPQAPDMTQPMGAMGFAGGGFVETKNQFGFGIDPQTGRSPVGEASWARYNAAAQGGGRSTAASFRATRQPVEQSASSNNAVGYGPLAQAAGLSTSAVRGVRDQARAAGSAGDWANSTASFGTPFMDRKAFARGGPVDTSGKMVVDPNPNAPTDSIPAVIDGQRPAALDSGELVIPKNAVMFHGVDKLNKLIAQAEKGSGDGVNT